MSLRSSRNLVIHQVSDSIPALSIKRQSVRFSHPAVRHVISALPTPLSTAGLTIPEHPDEHDSPITIDFPGQVNPSAIYHRRSRGTNTVLFEEVFSQLDVPADRHNSSLLRRREAHNQAKNRYSTAVDTNIDSQANDQPWPTEGLCGTIPAEPRTKSGLRALQYLSFHPQIREEAFSDEEIFKSPDAEKEREQHLQATLDQLNMPREDAPSTSQDLHPSRLQSHRAIDPSANKELPALSSYGAFNSSRHSNFATIPELSIAKHAIPKSASMKKSEEKKPVALYVEPNIEWEKALSALEQRDLASVAVSFPGQTMQPSVYQPNAPDMVENRRPDTAISNTPDFPTRNPNDLKRRTLLQSTALDLALATPAELNNLVTPRFSVLDQELELHRRTILGSQLRDLALTPAVFTTKPPAGIPRTFSIPRRGVGQAPKPQAISGLPYLPLMPVIEVLPSSQPSSSASSAAFAVQADMSTDQSHSLHSETLPKPKLSRKALLKKIISKNY
jgi:hypothetical protein